MLVDNLYICQTENMFYFVRILPAKYNLNFTITNEVIFFSTIENSSNSIMKLALVANISSKCLKFTSKLSID